MTDSNLIILVGSAATALTSVATIGFGIWRDGRTTAATVAREKLHREWAIEDRRVKAQDVADKVESVAEELRRTTAAQARTVINEIQKNTEISVRAFNEANDVNTKFLKLHARLDRIETHLGLPV
jgi:hypothetical protein